MRSTLPLLHFQGDPSALPQDDRGGLRSTKKSLRMTRHSPCYTEGMSSRQKRTSERSCHRTYSTIIAPPAVLETNCGAYKHCMVAIPLV